MPFDFWKYIAPLLGLPADFTLTSPRKALLNYVFGDMLKQRTVDLTAQSYLDNLSFYLYFVSALLAIQLVYAFVTGLLKGDIGVKLRDWFLTLGFFAAGLPFVPALLVTMQTVANAIGRQVFTTMMGSDDPQKAIATFSALTGNPVIDLGLGFVQAVLLLVLWVELKLVLIAMYISLYALIIGVAIRFLGSIGDKVFRLGVNITIYGVSGNAVVLLTWGLVSGFGRLIWRNDPASMAIVNTLAVACGLVAVGALRRAAGGKIAAAVEGVVAAGRALKERSHNSSNKEQGYESDGEDAQINEATRAQRSHATTTRPGRTATRSAGADIRYEESEDVDPTTEPTADEPTPRRPTQRRYSSDAAMSQRQMDRTDQDNRSADPVEPEYRPYSNKPYQDEPSRIGEPEPDGDREVGGPWHDEGNGPTTTTQRQSPAPRSDDSNAAYKDRQTSATATIEQDRPSDQDEEDRREI